MVKELYPIVLFLAQDVVGIRLVSEKTANKSIEQACLWEVHPQTKKEVEAIPRIPLSKIYKKGQWYCAEIDEEQYQTFTTEHKQAIGISTISMYLQNSNQDSHGVIQETLTKGDPQEYMILHTLHEIIQKRKSELPEGSYTTHLFNSGSEKIRKKLGEESIELVLADTPTRIVEESTDLLYHLFVLLAQESISPSLIMDELSNRFLK